MIGAALATAICTFLGQITLMNIYYSKKMHLPVMYMYKATFKGILPFQIMGAVVSILMCKTIQNTYISFFVGGIVFVAIVVIGCYYTGTLKWIKIKK